MYITTHHKKILCIFSFSFFLPLSSFSSCFKCYKEAKYSLSCWRSTADKQQFSPCMFCSSLASVSLKIYALLNDKKKCTTALCPGRPFGVWRTLTPSLVGRGGSWREWKATAYGIKPETMFSLFYRWCQHGPCAQSCFRRHSWSPSGWRYEATPKLHRLSQANCVGFVYVGNWRGEQRRVS